MKISGVYSITNNVTGDFYIGSSCNIKQRWVKHKCLSTHKQHSNSKLYKSIASYGLDNFTFEIIEETDNLREREQYWIEQLKPTYNSIRAKGRDIEISKEAHKRYCKEWHKIHRDEQLAYRQAHRDECLAKMKDWHKAHRDEHLAKMKADRNRLCLYNGETITLNALTVRLTHQGIPHAWTEAKKYLL